MYLMSVHCSQVSFRFSCRETPIHTLRRAGLNFGLSFKTRPSHSKIKNHLCLWSESDLQRKALFQRTNRRVHVVSSIMHSQYVKTENRTGEPVELQNSQPSSLAVFQENNFTSFPMGFQCFDASASSVLGYASMHRFKKYKI
jgi:hypothetical protein